MSANPKRIAFYIAFAAALLFNGILTAAYFGYRVNTTDSVPVGIYRQSQNPSSLYVMFCPTREQAQIANERGYRPRGLGCPDGFAPLMKPVRAREGDVVTLTAQGIIVNGTMVPNSKPLVKDGQGRPLPVLRHDTLTVAPGSLWVISSYNTASFDSRYFGPISKGRVIAYAQPIWTF